MISDSTKEILEGSATYAVGAGHSSVHLPVLAMALCSSREGRINIAHLQVDERSQDALNQALYEQVVLVPSVDSEDAQFQMSPSAFYVYKFATMLAERDSTELHPLHIMLALTDAQDDPEANTEIFTIASILARHGIYKSDVINLLSKSAKHLAADTSIDQHPQLSPKQVTASDKNSFLGLYCENLNERARAGHIEPVFGRDDEIDRVIRILSRRKKSNPLLVGEPGVGKTTIAEGLALDIVRGVVPPSLIDKTIFAVDMGALVSGVKWRGELEEKVKGLLQEAIAHGKAILFIDEIHTLTGKMMDGTGDLLKPALANGQLTCIGATTQTEYMMYFEKDAAMARRFQAVSVSEPDRETAIHILKGVIPRYASHHQVEYEDNVVSYAVDMSIRHIPRQFLPDKAIDLIDEAGAAAVSCGSDVVDKSHIDLIISDLVGKPNNLEFSDLTRQLDERVIGQEKAKAEAGLWFRLRELGIVKGQLKTVTAIKGLPNTGKKFFVKTVCDILGTARIDIDLAHYKQEAGLWKLIGSMPGYKDHERGGQLTEAIRRNPSSALVLRNPASADPAIVDLIVQMIETGRIEDSAGKIINASEVSVFVIEDSEPASSFGFASGSTEQAASQLPEALKGLVDHEITLAKIERITLTTMATEMVKELLPKASKAGLFVTVSTQAVQEMVDDAIEGGIDELRGLFSSRIRDRIVAAINSNQSRLDIREGM